MIQSLAYEVQTIVAAFVEEYSRNVGYTRCVMGDGDLIKLMLIYLEGEFMLHDLEKTT